MMTARWDRDRRLGRRLGQLLAAGTTISTLLLAAGLAGWMSGARGRFVSVCFHGGLLVLMATPVARVLASVVEYARARDWAFVAITLSVLAVLAGTLVAALRTAAGV